MTEIMEQDFKTAIINIIYAHESKGNMKIIFKKRKRRYKEKQMVVLKVKNKICEMNISLVRINRRFNTADDLIPSKRNEMRTRERKPTKMKKKKNSHVTTVLRGEKWKKQTNTQKFEEIMAKSFPNLRKAIYNSIDQETQ